MTVHKVSMAEAENHELRERLRDLVDVGRKNIELQAQIDALIKENHRLCRIIGKKNP